MKQQFSHDRLEAYRVTREFVQLAASILGTIPRGESAIRDQLKRASDSALLNIAEGAGRRAWAEKAHFYEIARASGAECAAALDVIQARQLGGAELCENARSILHRAVCLIAGLVRGARARAAG